MNSLPGLVQRRLVVALFALTPSLCFSQLVAETFLKGIYRQDGHQCIQLSFAGNPAKGQCVKYVGVLSQRDGKPEFMFGEKPQAVIFVASGATPTISGDRVSYPISEVVDLQAGLVVAYQGQCVLQTSERAQTLNCETVGISGAPAWSAFFEGNGVWLRRPWP